jgi:hypothetical protein
MDREAAIENVSALRRRHPTRTPQGADRNKVSSYFSSTDGTYYSRSLMIISLHALQKGQDQDVVDYIDFWYPGLKEQIRNLSSLFPGIIASGPP